MVKVTGSSLMNESTKRLFRQLKNKVDNGTATKYENRRYNQVIWLVNREIARVSMGYAKNSGLNGCIYEILTSKDTSRKNRVASQGKVDGYFTYNGKRIPIELKTNGGRIGSLYRKDGTPRAGFIVYNMCFDTRSKKKDKATGEIVKSSKHCETESLVFRIEDFINLLEDCKAIKMLAHADKNDREPAIVGDSMKLYKRLLEYPLVYDPQAKYTEEDFEGLEI